MTLSLNIGVIRAYYDNNGKEGKENADDESKKMKEIWPLAIFFRVNDNSAPAHCVLL